MIPVSLRLRNFMSYADEVPPLDFSHFTTACLTGDNGHGKSALLDAITWALWGQARAKSLDDIVRMGQDEAEVEFMFDLEDARYRVIRKRSLRTKAGQSSLELQGYDAATDQFKSLSGNSMRETESKIVQLLHMNYDTFVNSVFILQGRADEFTTRRPGERKRILSEILGLGVFDDLEARAKMHRGSLDQDVKTLMQRLEELQQDVARKDELATAVSTHHTTLEQTQTELQNVQQRLDQLRQQHTTLEVQSLSVQETERRLQRLRHDIAEVERQMSTHQRRVGEYETILQQESMITAAYGKLLQLREEERRESGKAAEYAVLQQRLASLEQAVTTAAHRLELEQRNIKQLLDETQEKLNKCEAVIQEAPRIHRAYDTLQETRQRETAMAQALQQRYVLEREKSQVEARLQQKRHMLELEQRSLLERQLDWEQKEAQLPHWERQSAELQQQLAGIEQYSKRRDQVQTDGVAIRVQLETSLPQALATLQQEIIQHQDKQQLLTTADAHCPLCEQVLSDHERRQVMHKLEREVSACEDKIQLLRREQQQLEQQRQSLRTEYKQLEQYLEQQQTLEEQHTTVRMRLQEALRARESRAVVLEQLQHLDAQITSGDYANDEVLQLSKLATELDQLTYDQHEHDIVKRTLADLATTETQLVQLRQAQDEQDLLRTKQQELTEHECRIEQTLRNTHYAVAEQRELQEVTASMAQLDFHPVAYNALRQRLQDMQHIERQHIELEGARQQLTNERTTLQELEARHHHYKTEIALAEQELQHSGQELHALQTVREDIEQTEVFLQQLRQREGDTRLALGRSQAAYEHCLQRETELHEKTTQRDQSVSERTLYGELAQIFGKNGIQALIIENAIPELEDEANRILSRVTDNAMHLTLETQRDTRAGGVAETLDIKISDTLGTRNYELFSGGEAFRINFALRIALSKMLARRAGARLRTLVIDEGFGTQDSQGLERLVEVIKAIQNDFAKIIIITHLKDLKNAFDTHIEVKKDPVRGSMYQVL